MPARVHTWLLVAACASGCGGELVDTFDACEITALLSPTAALPGETVTILGGPQTTTYDTLVQADGTRCEVLEVTRSTECADCDTCRAEHQSCGGCTDECAACVETVAFVAPDLPPGPTVLVLTNGYGTTGALDFEVLAATGSETGGTGATP
jgi:hypothetical protein